MHELGQPVRVLPILPIRVAVAWLCPAPLYRPGTYGIYVDVNFGHGVVDHTQNKPRVKSLPFGCFVFVREPRDVADATIQKNAEISDNFRETK